MEAESDKPSAEARLVDDEYDKYWRKTAREVSPALDDILPVCIHTLIIEYAIVMTRAHHFDEVMMRMGFYESDLYQLVRMASYALFAERAGYPWSSNLYWGYIQYRIRNVSTKGYFMTDSGLLDIHYNKLSYMRGCNMRIDRALDRFRKKYEHHAAHIT